MHLVLPEAKGTQRVVRTRDFADFLSPKCYNRRRMSLNLKWPNATNKGTAMLKLLHQRFPRPLVPDRFLSWFVDDSSFVPVMAIDSLLHPAHSPQEEFQRNVFWYSALREKYFDELVLHSIQNGSRQLLLLGSGFDTRYLRLAEVADTSIQTFEVDLESTITEMRTILTKRLGQVPPNLHLLTFDFNHDELEDLFSLGVDHHRPTVCIWQGVSYYLPKHTVEHLLTFINSALPTSSIFGFDSCSPLMLQDNDEVPGIRFNIEALKAIGEPYIFGMDQGPMEDWLERVGYVEVRTQDQKELEERYRPGIELARNMWYVVSAKTRGNPAC